VSDKPPATVDPLLDPDLLARASQRAFPDREADAARLMQAIKEEQRLQREERALENFAPFQVHFIASGLTVPTGPVESEVMVRGRELQVNQKIYRASLDSTGRSIFDLTDDEQTQRWGEPKVHKGPWPADVPRLPEQHTQAWYEAKAAAYRQAYSIQDRSQRVLAIQQTVDTYGEPDYNPGALSVAGEGS
jgi:hypothetical protein